jgi:peptidoglycan hydrolase-like protein with peptidoglycan-binding domain
MPDPNGLNLAQLKTEHANSVVAQRGDGLTPDRAGLVGIIQDDLKDLGFYNGKQDGIYGEKTTLAVQEFQKAVGLPPTGAVDKKTFDALNALEGAALYSTTPDDIYLAAETEPASRHKIDLSKFPVFQQNANVVFAQLGDIMNPYKADAVQGALKDLGFYNGEHDSVYGEKTMSAVREFQRAVGLPPTGAVDKKTLTVLDPLQDAAQNAPSFDAMNLKRAEGALGHKIDLCKIPALRRSGSDPAQRKQPARTP